MDVITDEIFDRQRQFLLEQAISVKYLNHDLWLPVQSYSAKNRRREARTILVWYLKEMVDVKMIYDANNVLTCDGWVLIN